MFRVYQQDEQDRSVCVHETARYGEANRYAIEHASLEPRVITWIESVETPRECITAYVATSRRRLALVGPASGSPASEIRALAEDELRWLDAHYAQKVGA